MAAAALSAAFAAPTSKAFPLPELLVLAAAGLEDSDVDLDEDDEEEEDASLLGWEGAAAVVVGAGSAGA